MKNQLRFYKNIWTTRIINDKGQILFEDVGCNNLTQDGQAWIMQAAFQKSFSTDRLFIRLANQTLATTDELSAITTEPIGNGYEPKEITRDTLGFPNDPTIVDTYSVLVSKSVEWTAAGGNIGPLSIAFLATSDNDEIPDASGKLLAYKELSVAQTILSGNTGTIYMQITLA